MYSCSGDRDHAGAAGGGRAVACGAKYQPCCNTAPTSWAAVHQGAGQVVPSDAQQQPPRPRPRKRHLASSSASRRSSTTVVATDVSNFRAMVQELTGFPPAAIFRPQPRRAHAAAAASNSQLAAAHGCGGAALLGRGSEAAATAGNLGSRDVPAVAQTLTHPAAQCALPGVFDGLADLGSPEFDAWPDLSFE